MEQPLKLRCGLVLAAAVAMTGAAASLAQTGAPETGKQGIPGCGPRVWIEYTDDDPDYFIIRNRSPEGWSLVMLGFDLAASAGHLVFDTDEGGPGVGGASAFYATSASAVRLLGTVPAQDGGKTLALQFEGFAPGERYAFRIDLDALPPEGGRTWVLPADIKGARVLATFEGSSGQREKVDAIFNADAEADSGAGGCV